MTPEEFETVVEEALDTLPGRFAALLDNIVVMVEDLPDAATMEDLGLAPDDEPPYGIYSGVPLSDRGDGYGGYLPDRVLIFRRPLLDDFSDRDELRYQIQLTVLHEVGHHLGLDDDEMEAWED